MSESNKATISEEELIRQGYRKYTGDEVGRMTWTNVGEEVMIINHTFISPDLCG